MEVNHAGRWLCCLLLGLPIAALQHKTFAIHQLDVCPYKLLAINLERGGPKLLHEVRSTWRPDNGGD